MKSDRQVIPSLIACPYLNVEVENSQFCYNAATSSRPINSKVIGEADSKSHVVAKNKNAKIVCSLKLETSPISFFFGYRFKYCF